MINYGFGVSLHPLDSLDCERIRGWRNQYEVWKWCRQSDPISDAEQKLWYEAQSKDPSIKMYMIHAQDRDVGVCGLTSIDLIARRAEFSLYISPKDRGMGYAKAGLKTLFKHGFDSFGLNLIWGETFDGNPALKLFLDLGMVQEGTRRQFYFKEGKFLNAHLVSLLSSEFNRDKC